MKRIIIVHRWEGTAEGDWYPWLVEKLRNKGYEVIVPDMPDTDAPEIGLWVSYLSSTVGEADSETYLVGHSIGAQTILRYLERTDTHIGGAVFVAGWLYLENLEDEDVKKIAEPWLTTPIDLAKVQAQLPHATLIISDNDPYGAFEKNREKFKELGVKEVIVHNGGHITAPEVPIILEEVLSLIKSDI